jgi:hypothetical protein
VGEVNGIPPTGKKISVDAISIHRMAGGKIAETWEVWDTLGFLQQLGVVPAPEEAVDREGPSSTSPAAHDLPGRVSPTLARAPRPTSGTVRIKRHGACAGAPRGLSGEEVGVARRLALW